MHIKILNNLVLGENHLGKAVYAGKDFKKGDIIIKFSGKILDKKNIPKSYKGEKDRYLQIDLDKFLGPSGDLDDLINHSCEPNSGLVFKPYGIILIAIKDIKRGDEVTWDYSTTLLENQWKMRCRCGNKKCRLIIEDFSLIPKKTQAKYKKLKIIPKYIIDYMDGDEYKLWHNKK